MNKHLFIIDDDEDDIEFLSIALKEVNNKVVCESAKNAQEAFVKLHGQMTLPGLILLDLNLPGLSGNEILLKLKSDPILKKIPVAVYSTSCLRLHKEECFSLGAIAYIIKPAKFSDIKNAVNEILSLFPDID